MLKCFYWIKKNSKVLNIVFIFRKKMLEDMKPDVKKETPDVICLSPDDKETIQKNQMDIIHSIINKSGPSLDSSSSQSSQNSQFNSGSLSQKLPLNPNIDKSTNSYENELLKIFNSSIQSSSVIDSQKPDFDMALLMSKTPTCNTTVKPTVNVTNTSDGIPSFCSKSIIKDAIEVQSTTSKPIFPSFSQCKPPVAPPPPILSSSNIDSSSVPKFPHSLSLPQSGLAVPSPSTVLPNPPSSVAVSSLITAPPPVQISSASYLPTAVVSPLSVISPARLPATNSSITPALSGAFPVSGVNLSVPPPPISNLVAPEAPIIMNSFQWNQELTKQLLSSAGKAQI